MYTGHEQQNWRYLLVGDLSIAHEEDSPKILDACLLIKVCKVVLEIWNAISFAQGDLEHLHGADVGCQP